MVSEISPLPEFDPFFTYTCDACGANVCERVQLMNLALTGEEDLYCLSCLARRQETTDEELATVAKGYIHSRECFEKPWLKFDASSCPRIQNHQCFCQDQP